MIWNSILVYNAFFLLLLMGVQQGYNCCEQHFGYAFLPVMQMCGRLCPLMTGELYPYFFLASFIAPTVAILLAKTYKIGRRQIAILLILNPILFALVSFSYQQNLDPGCHWKFSKVMGPVIIGDKKERSSLAAIACMTCVQIGWASWMALHHRDIFQGTSEENEVSNSFVKVIRNL